MKKKLVVLLLLMCLLLTACASREDIAASEEVSADYGLVVTMTQEEFRRTFSGFENLEITETAAMVRPSNEQHVVVQITYTSANGSGVYGFEYEKSESGNITLIQQGGDVTILSLLN